MVRVSATVGMNLGEYFPINVFACWNLGLVLGLDFLHLQDVWKEHRVDCLGVGGALGCCVCPFPTCCLRITPCPAVHIGWLPTRRRGLHSGAISAWGRDLSPLPWYLERDTVDRKCVSK